MKVELDNWETCYTGTAFVVEMQCAPRVGEVLLIHKSLFPASYYEEPYDISPMVEVHDGLIQAKVTIVKHVVTDNGHIVRVCIDV